MRRKIFTQLASGGKWTRREHAVHEPFDLKRHLEKGRIIIKTQSTKNAPQGAVFSPHALQMEKDVKREFFLKIDNFPDEDKAFLTKAFNYADEMHKGQKRMEGNEKLPYIIHPLRVTIYLVSIGITDKYTLAVALLHDTVEDCSHKMVNARNKTVSERMKLASEVLSEAFGIEVGESVFELSNTPLPKGMGIQDKRREYHRHVRQVLVKSPEHVITLIVKFGDFKDNAGRIDPKDGSKAAHFYAKYQPMVKIFGQSFDIHKDNIDPGVLLLAKKDLKSIEMMMNKAQKVIFA